MSALVLSEQREGLLWITLNRPEKRNAINFDLWAQLDAAVRQAAVTEGVRAVLLQGAGPSFSSGIDVTNFMLLAQKYGEGWRQRMRTITADFQAVLNRLERLELPTIALLHGHCLGLALELALACDIRLAAEGTRLGLPETRLGMIPDFGGTTRLTRLVVPARAKEMIFTGREIDAAQAAGWGWSITSFRPGRSWSGARRWAPRLPPATPLAVGMAKRVIDGLSDLDRGLQLEGWAQSQLFQAKTLWRRSAPSWSGAPEFKGR